MKVCWEWGEGDEKFRIVTRVTKRAGVFTKLVELHEWDGVEWGNKLSCSATSHYLLAEVVRMVRRVKDQDQQIAVLQRELANLRRVKEDDHDVLLREINAGLLGLVEEDPEDDDPDW